MAFEQHGFAGAPGSADAAADVEVLVDGHVFETVFRQKFGIAAGLLFFIARRRFNEREFLLNLDEVWQTVLDLGKCRPDGGNRLKPIELLSEVGIENVGHKVFLENGGEIITASARNCARPDGENDLRRSDRAERR